MMPARWLVAAILAMLAACGGSVPSAVSRDSGNLLLTADHGGEGEAWGQQDCAACHPLGVIHSAAEDIRDLVRDKGYVSCAGCHGSNGTALQRSCQLCHNTTDLPMSPMQGGAHRHSFSNDVSAAQDDADCLTCHQASDMNGRFDASRDLTLLQDARGLYTPYVRRSDFCLRCHNDSHQQSGFEITAAADDPLVAIESYFKRVDRHGLVAGTGEGTYAGLRAGLSYGSVVDCDECHAMHGTDNDGLIIDDSRKGLFSLDAAIREHPYRIRTTAGNTAQLCVMCHRMEAEFQDAGLDAGNGLDGLHDVSSDCSECHSHGEAIQAGM